jgi:pilus assembly protein Flp/PilA
VEGLPLRPIADCRKRFTADESGATMVEYGLLLLFIALIVIAAAKILGQNVLPLFQVSQLL